MFRSVPSIVQAQVASQAGSTLERAVAALATSFSAIGREIRTQRALHQVGTLDDRMLADIGIGHGQAEGAIRHGRDAVGPRVPSPRDATRIDLGAGWTDWR